MPQLLFGDDAAVKELDPLAHLGLGLDRRGQWTDGHLQTRSRIKGFAGEGNPVLQQGGEERGLLDRQGLEQRIALAGGEADLQLSTGGTTAAAGDQGIAAHRLVEALQPGPVLGERAGPDLHELEGRIRRQVHAGVRTQDDGSGGAVPHSIHHPLANADRESRTAQQLLVLALTAEMVQVLVRQAQMGKIPVAKG